MGIAFDIVSAEQFQRMEAEWDALVDASAAPSVFLTWAWHAAALRFLPDGAQVRFVAVRQDGMLMALAPLVRWPGFPRRLRFAVTQTAADHLDFIVRADHPEAVVRALREGVLEAATDVDALDLESCAEDSFAHRLLGTLAGFRPALLLRTADCPFVDLSGGFDAYLQARFDKKRRYNILRDVRRAAEQFELVHDAAAPPDQLPERLRELFDLHAARKSARGVLSSFLTEDSRAFHEAVSELLALRGRLSLQFMRKGGVPQSVLYGFQYGGRFSYFQSGITAEGERMSAGSVLIALAMKGEGANDAPTEFDFLRGNEPYKARWTTSVRKNFSWRAYRAGAAGALFAAYHSNKARLRSLVRKREVAAIAAEAEVSESK